MKSKNITSQTLPGFSADSVLSGLYQDYGVNSKDDCDGGLERLIPQAVASASICECLPDPHSETLGSIFCRSTHPYSIQKIYGPYKIRQSCILGNPYRYDCIPCFEENRCQHTCDVYKGDVKLFTTDWIPCIPCVGANVTRPFIGK